MGGNTITPEPEDRSLGPLNDALLHAQTRQVPLTIIVGDSCPVKPAIAIMQIGRTYGALGWERVTPMRCKLGLGSRLLHTRNCRTSVDRPRRHSSSSQQSRKARAHASTTSSTMQEDLIVVDDDPPAVNGAAAGPSTPAPRLKIGLPAPAASSSSRPRRAVTLLAQTPVQTEAQERTTRSAAARGKPQPKLKLKLSEKAAAQAPGMSFLGPYDRELDSDDEELAFEEQFILRLPPGEDCDRLRKMVAEREVSNDVWFKFKGMFLRYALSHQVDMKLQDSRRAVFHIGNNTYSSKLVDLPCIIETQKTLDGKQMFKVADICQVYSSSFGAFFMNTKACALDAGG